MPIKSIREWGIHNPYEGAGTSASVIRDGYASMASTSTTNTVTGCLAGTLTNTGTAGDLRDATEGRGCTYQTTAVANGNAGIRWTNQNFRSGWGCYMILRMKVDSASDVRCYIGWSSDTNDIAGETTLNNFSGAGVGKRAADTNWFTYANNGAASETRADTGLAFGTTVQTIELALNTTNFISKIGTTTPTAVTTPLPASTTDLTPIIQIETGSGAANRTLSLYPIYARSGPI